MENIMGDSEREFSMLDQVELNILEESNDDQQKGSTPNKLKDFDDILEFVGSEGKYQKLILYGVITPFMILLPVLTLNKIFMLSIPTHNCHVPGRPNGTDLATWQNLTLPKEIGPDGHSRLSQCKMFSPEDGVTPVTCDKWDYDKTDYDSTIATDYNWVCDKSHYATNVFTATFAGSIFGSVIFGRAADRWGRKRIILLILLMYIVLQMVCLFIPQYFIAFLVLHFISDSVFPSIFLTPVMVLAEMSGKDYRGWIYAFTWMAWVTGHCALSLVAWLCRSWFLIGLVTTLPSISLLLLIYKVLPESPRWLMSMGRIEESKKIIQKISLTNNRPMEDHHLDRTLQHIVDNDKDVDKDSSFIKGTLTIFKKKRLAFNTIMLCIACSMNRLLYDGLTLNATNMSGNEFLNFFLLGVIEFPAGWLAALMVDNGGRRWTQAGFFVLSSIALLIASISAFSPHLSWLLLTATVMAKFGVTITELVVYLQATELFPTQLRSTGNGVSNFVASVLGVWAPYVVYLGNYNAAAPYILLGILSVTGAVSASFLPETLNLSLPESVEEANELGENDGYWSFLPHRKNKIIIIDDGKDCSKRKLGKIN